jgi:hypothetical protein
VLSELQQKTFFWCNFYTKIGAQKIGVNYAKKWFQYAKIGFIGLAPV